MKNLIYTLLLLGISSIYSIEVGQSAYNFKLNDETNQVVQLSGLKGKWVVLYFFPKADTPGCTTQGKEYSKMFDKFTASNAVVYGISTDDVASLKRFKEKYGFKHKFLSDPKGEIAKSYGVRVVFGMCARDTILINPDLKVEKIYKGVDPGADPYKVLEYITSKNKT